VGLDFGGKNLLKKMPKCMAMVTAKTIAVARLVLVLPL